MQDAEIFFVGETHFENVPYVQRGRFLTGGKKKAETPKKKESRTVIGGLNLKTQKVYRRQTDRGSSESFIEFLFQIKQSFPAVLTILILDSSGIHKSKKAENFLRRNPLFKIKLLTPYSPEYNPTGRFRLRLKKKVYGNNAYRSIKDAIAKLGKVIWHYHKNRLTDPIKFNFKPYAEIL